MVTKAERAAKKRYDAKTVQFVLRLRLDHDADIIQRMRSMENKTDYFRALVRRDMHGA